MKYDMLIEIIKDKIKDLEESKNLWLKQLDECPFDSTAEQEVNEKSAQIRTLNYILEKAGEL